MAKLFGLNGYVSGKLGNNVLAVTNGIQVVKQYQPVVSNPKSYLQSIQRAKGNLAGRVSGFTPKAAIYGLGKNARTRRGEFLRNLLKSATTSKSGNDYTAKIADEKVIFSKGSVVTSVITPTFNVGLNLADITLTGVSTNALPADEYAARQTRIVAMVYDAANGDLVEVVTKMATKPAQGGTAITELAIAHPSGYDIVFYAIPMSTADGSSVSIDTSIASKSDDEIAAILSANRNAVVFDYGQSYVLGQAFYTPQP